MTVIEKNDGFDEIERLLLSLQDERIYKDLNKRKVTWDEIRIKISAYLKNKLMCVKGLPNDRDTKEHVRYIIDELVHMVSSLMPVIMVEQPNERIFLDVDSGTISYDVVSGDSNEVRNYIEDNVRKNMPDAEEDAIMSEILARMEPHDGHEIVVMPKDTSTLLLFQTLGIK